MSIPLKAIYRFNAVPIKLRLDRITDSVDLNLSKHRETVNREAWYTAVHGVAESDTPEWLNNKNQITCIYNGILLSHNKEWNPAIYNNVYGPRDIMLSEISDEGKYSVLSLK